MTDTTTETPAAVAPAFPAASIDFNRVHKNADKGATGGDLFAGAIAAPPAPPPPEASATGGETDAAKKPAGGKSTTTKTDAA